MKLTSSIKNRKSLLTTRILLCIIALIVFESCGTHKPQFEGTPLEKHTSLAETGFTQQKLDSLRNYIDENLTTTGMIILKNGKLLFEYGDVQDLSYLASVRKSILSMLYGKYVENGIIDLDETIGDIGVEEDSKLTEVEKSATVYDIINSRSGVFYTPVNPGSDNNNILERGSKNPGEYFVYNNWDYNVAGYIFEKKTGKDIYQELEEKLAIPLGFQDWNIKNQKKQYNKNKSRYPAYHMYISVRDMAKIGQLMLNKGKWNGKQLISESWIEKITSTVTKTEEINERKGLTKSSPYQLSYGYMWWIIDNIKHHPDFEGAYHASGYAGQYITVIPKLNMVVAHKHRMPNLVRLGLKSGNDVPYWQYFGLLHDFMTSDRGK
ncbi:serine hydrolase [Aquimarina sp. 2201CG5-10]|uniref:serine hydrolase domain-containing protein n=1 Tax=Aquimarina callyspongiae TaxID=3098150 RepID=UPI002AB50299|nr:serine hydrolase [Aquimarina sp. 2201CG5-10]MDY8135999.1 serine hydrolase [Aquimarina sp. 2201CG5-10]